MSADSPIMGQWSDTDQQDPSKAYALSGKIMLASVITLFIIVFFLVLLHLYARWYLTRLHRRHDTLGPNRQNRSTRMVYLVANNRIPGSGSTGLDASVLKSLPLFIYSNETKADANVDVNVVDCAVCLSEFEEGETGRVLPNCKHCFHIECIDMWFCSHSTCPLCRSPVEPVQTGPEPGSSGLLMETMETTSSVEGRRKRVDVRIDVPVNEMVSEGELRMTSPSQGFRSPGSRLLSLKRIININMGRVSPSSSGVGPSCEPVGTESDVESARQESDHELSRQGNIG